MSEVFDDPFGLGAPRQRLDEAETVERMLEAGARMVRESGLRISFDLLRLEDVIAHAGVSRSAVYKRWPRKELFYSELLLRLAGAVHPATAAFDLGTPVAIVRVAHEHSNWFRTAEGRHRLLIEMCRLGALQNFEALRERPDWRIYMTIHSALLTLPDNSYRAALESVLANSEREFAQKMAGFYSVLMNMLGYRFKDDSGNFGMLELAALGATAVEGVVLTSGATPDLATRRFLLDPFDTGRHQDWSYPAISFTGLVTSLIVQDDLTAWSEEKMVETEIQLNMLAETVGRPR